MLATVLLPPFSPSLLIPPRLSLPRTSNTPPTTRLPVYSHLPPLPPRLPVMASYQRVPDKESHTIDIPLHSPTRPVSPQEQPPSKLLVMGSVLFYLVAASKSYPVGCPLVLALLTKGLPSCRTCFYCRGS